MDNIYVWYINLDIRIDKQVKIYEQIINLGFNKNKINRFSAINGFDILMDLKNKNYLSDEIISKISIQNKIYRNNVLGCLLSHYFLLKQISENNDLTDDSIVFIYEDDFFINKEYLYKTLFTEVIKKIKNFSKINSWDMIYLGGRYEKNFIPKNYILESNMFSKIDNNFYKRNSTGYSEDFERTTHNYIINKKSAKKICEIILANFESDNYMSEIDTLYNNILHLINAYDYFPHIFYSPVNYTTDIQQNYNCIKSEDFANFLKN